MSTESHYIHNPFHAALTTANAAFAITNGKALRYQPGIIPFAALAEPTNEALADLISLLSPNEEIFLTTGPGELAPQHTALQHILELPGFQMLYTAPHPPSEDDTEILTLTSADTTDMLALKALAFPGYFGPRARELGDFVGIRDPRTNELIAMAGERLSTFTHRELSAVCTHPAHTGKGYAARLIRTILRKQATRNTTGILHVVAANTRAIALYHHLGYVTTGEITFHQYRSQL